MYPVIPFIDRNFTAENARNAEEKLKNLATESFRELEIRELVNWEMGQRTDG